jgi:hypothetical protein
LDRKEKRKKIRAIILWYELSSKTMEDSMKLKLLNLWKNICIEFEEYEIASGLRRKRSLVLREIRHKKGKGRSPLQTMKLRLRIFKRWIKRLF